MEHKSLKDKTVSGISWSAVEKILQNIFVFISGILLARILDKENYGLMAILAIFVALANILQESGFTTALIRKKEIGKSDYITVFYINISIGILLYLLLFFSAPLISYYYKEPLLIPLARFLFLSFLFTSFAIVQYAKLIKEINYKLIAKINSTAVFISYVVSLLLAYNGFGVWALASQIVVASFLKMCGLWLFSKWKPTGQFSGSALKELFAFSSKLLLGSVLNIVMVNLPQNVIAKCYNISIAGLYNQAYKNYNSASDILVGTVYNVSFPILSTIDDEDRLRNAFRKFIRIKALAIFPLYMGMALVATPFMHLLGEQWLDAAPILQLLAASGVFLGLETANSDLLRVKGKSGLILKLTILNCVLIGLAIFVPYICQLHYLYYVVGVSLAYVIRYIVSSKVCVPLINYKLKDLCKDLFPYFAISLLSVACGFCLKFIISNYIVLLIAQVVVVGGLYCGILYVSGSKIFHEAINYVRKKN